MNFPQKAYDIVLALYNRDAALPNPLAKGSDSDRRKLTRKMAEQICFDLGDDWGTKATSSTASQSKDAIAFRTGPGSMDIWDWQNGSTREIQVKAGDAPDYPNVTNQHFIQVNPVNHLSTNIPGPNDPPPDDGEPEEDEGEPVDDTVKLLLMQIVSKLSELVELNKAQTTTFQNGLNELKAEISKGIKIRF